MGPVAAVPGVVPEAGPVVDAGPPDDVVDAAPVEVDGPVVVVVVGAGVGAVEDNVDVDVCTDADRCS